MASKKSALDDKLSEYEQKKKEREERLRKLREAETTESLKRVIGTSPVSPRKEEPVVETTTRKDSRSTKPVEEVITSPTAATDLSGLSARERRARRATLDKEDEAIAETLRERRARREEAAALKVSETTPERKSSVSRYDESSSNSKTSEVTSPRSTTTESSKLSASEYVPSYKREPISRTTTSSVLQRIEEEKAKLAARTSTLSTPSKSINLFVMIVGVWLEDGDYLRTFNFDFDTSIERVIKTIVRRSYLKSEAKEFSLWHHSGADLEELTDQEQDLANVGLRSFDLVYLMPKKAVKVQLMDGTAEQIHLDFNMYALNALSVIAIILGWEDIEDFLLVRMVPGKEPQELSLRKMLTDEGVADNDNFILIEDKDKAREEKKEARKKRLLALHTKKLAGIEEYKTAKVSIQELQSKPSTVGLTQLQASLMLSTTWFNSFLKHGGLEVLFELLIVKPEKIQYSGRDDNHFRFLDKCVHCILVVLNSGPGLNKFMTIQHASRKLISQLDPVINVPTLVARRKMVIDMLTGITMLSAEGAEQVLDALDFYMKFKHEKGRFTMLAEGLAREADIPLKLSYLTLINAIVGAPEALEQRVIIRNELIDLGVIDTFKKLKGTDDDLDEQITEFEDGKKEDEDEVKEMAETTLKIDSTDVVSVFNALRKTCVQPDKLLSILQKMLGAAETAANADTNTNVWTYIDSVVEKVVALQKDQTLGDLFVSHEDFSTVRHNYDEQVDNLNQRIRELEQGSTDKSLQKIKELEQSLRNRNQEMDLLKAKLKEAEATIEELERRLIKSGTLPVSPRDPNQPTTEAPAPPEAPGSSAPPPPPPPEVEAPPPPAPGGPPPPPPPAPGGPPPPPAPGGPPPPPGMGPPLPGAKAADGIPGLPPKPVVNPSTKLKHLGWKKLPNNKILATIWGNAKDEIPLDVNTLEYLFAAKQAAPKEKTEEVVQKKVVVNLLDSKRANHVGIALGKLKKSPSDVRAAIIELNDQSLTLDELMSVRTLLPNSEELTKIREFSGDRKQLDRPEQFFMEIESIPNLISRVENWIFSRTFEERAHETLPQITTVTRAFKQCTTSAKLFRLLQIILAIGNYLNGGTANGRAYGFKVDVLLKLTDTKSADDIVHLVEGKFPEVMEWMSELESVPPASKISSQNLRDDMQAMRVGVQKVFDEIEQIEAQENQDPLNSSYLTRMKLFASSAKKKFNVLNEEMDVLMKEFKTVAVKYGEDPETYKWEDFFGLILSFNEMWEKAKNDNKKEAKKSANKQKKLIRRSDTVGGINDIFLQGLEKEEGKKGTIKQRNSIRRVKSIRKKNTDGSEPNNRNLNSLLEMLDQMKK